jgi:lysophospholipase L1-like esterase
MKNKFIYLAIIAAGFASCEPEFDKEVGANYSSGEADFTSYVAIGNSLTAGYMDGTVSRVGQTYSYPNLLAQQFALVGGGAFTQPSFAEDVNNLGGIQGLTGTRLVINASVGGVQPIAGSPTITLTPQAMAYNNMGVPGAKSFHLLAPGYGSAANLLLGRANPYFVRHATSSSATVIGDAMTKNPTFFTNWIGANDVLAYATSGGTMPDNPLTTTVDESVMSANDHNTTGNINPLTYGPNDITNTNLYESTYRNMINTLTNGGAKGVVCTIPSVTSIPYFTTVPFNPVPLDNAKATQLNTGFATYNGALDFAFSNGLITNAERLARKINFVAGKNPVVIVDNDLTNLSTFSIPSYRMTTSQDLIVLTASSFIGTQVGTNPLMINGLSVPLANKWVLTATEKSKVASATNAFNASIRSIAATKNLAVADMNSIMTQLVSGLRIETGQVYTANYFSGSATEGLVLFSLDGVHPNARGYAVITNEIIKVINAHYKSNLPLHNPSYFPGINIVGSN